MTFSLGKNHKSGFPPSVFRHQSNAIASSSGGIERYGGDDNERILLLSNIRESLHKVNANTKVDKGPRRRLRTKNRKYVTRSTTYKHGGKVYRINNRPSYGVYTRILSRGLDQLEVCLSKWRRVFVIRFDLHQKFHTSKNAMVSRLRDNLLRRFGRAYDISEMGYLWVREQGSAKQQHYHFILFLDGDVINHSARISEIIRSTWEDLKVGNSMHLPKNSFYNLVEGDHILHESVVDRLSYLAKQRGKGFRPKQTKDFSTSRLIAPPKYDFKTGKSLG